MRCFLLLIVFFLSTASLLAQTPDYSQPGDIVINEVMANPTGLTLLPETEYIEIYNTSSDTIYLNGWTFIYGTTNIALPDTFLLSGNYAVLYRAGRDISVDSGGMEIPISNFPANLANSGKDLQLRNSHSVQIDSITYQTATAARSWERAADGSWYLSNDARGGTPGSENSPQTPPAPPSPPDNSQPGNVVINEVMANPTGLTQLPETEYVEIYNTSSDTIYLNDWTFIYGTTNIALPDTFLLSESYAVLYRAGRDISVDSEGMEIPISNFPANLANSGKDLQLRNSHSVQIDSITYQTATAARSWERAADDSWYLSNDTRGGTPGSENSPQTPPAPPSPSDNSQPGDVVINEVMANPTGLNLLSETEYVEIYNTSSDTIYLNDWTFIYGTTNIALPDTFLLSGSYAVLYRAGRDISVDSGGMEIPISNFPANLTNSGKDLQLRNSHSVQIDSITYQTATAARSWERASDNSWYLSNDTRGGTPGSENSPQTPPAPPTKLDNSKPGDVLINEIMANPTGLTQLPETEYIELYNVSDSAWSLKNWTFVYDGKATQLPDTILAAGQYAVLYRSGRDIHVDNGGLDLPIATFPSALSNSGKTLSLRNANNVTIDTIVYATAKAGISWERADTLYLSTDPRGGTPGSINSEPFEPMPPTPAIPDYSQPGDVLINEIMADPKGLKELPETEYVELFNATESAIRISGWTFIYDSKHTALPDTILNAGQYAILYREGRDIHVDSGGIALPLTTFASNLSNSGKTIKLQNANEELIDSFTYAKAKAALSWERTDEGAWHLSADPRGGTPGSRNSSPNPDEPEQPDKPEQEPILDYSQPGDVLINEIMADPKGLTELPETEYVELFNTTDSARSLRNWMFVYDGKHTALPDTILPAKSYAVLYRAGRDIHVDSNGFDFPIYDFPSALSNNGKSVWLQNAHGTMIDSVAYAKAKTAFSWERAEDNSWHVSHDPRGGTPGSVNSLPKADDTDSPENPDENPDEIVKIESGALLFNEILAEPSLGGSEYIELYNHTDRPLRLSGLALATRKADNSLSTLYSLSSIAGSLLPGEYLVLTSNRDGVLDFYYTPVPDAIHELKLPALNNSGATLVLLQKSDNAIIDEVTYSSKWHDIAIKSFKGVSLERIRFDEPTQDAANWTSATAEVGYGTPGYKNSQTAGDHSENKISMDSPEYKDGLDYYAIEYHTDKPGYRCRVEVYSTNGKKMAEIANNQILSQDGELRWNGRGSDNGRLTPGVYVFYAEMYHPDGDKKSFKRAFLIR